MALAVHNADDLSSGGVGEPGVKDVCVCILAYNEQKHIADTIRAVSTGNGDAAFDIIVYANGCTDNTADVVRALCATIPNLRLRELAKASKPNAWNTAFAENDTPFLFFSDGDVRPEPGSVVVLRRCFEEHPHISLVCSQFWPHTRGLSIQRRLTGFLQIPLAQDFLTGQFYAVRRSYMKARLADLCLQGVPEGIVGEDAFLGLLFPGDMFLVAREKVFYEPPTVADYWKYLARMRWQGEQLTEFYGNLLAERGHGSNGSSRARLAAKLAAGQGLPRTLLGLLAAASRTVVKSLFKAKIDKCYRGLGSVCREGNTILSHSTRSESAK